MADQCGRCACVMEDWEHDLCLVCRVIVGLSGEADPGHEDARTWRTPWEGGHYSLNLDQSDPGDNVVAWWLGDLDGSNELGRVYLDESQLGEMIADLTRRLVLISGPLPAEEADHG